ncbi:MULTISPECIES: LuxR C-terminal-related transcriptional regulator [unclassified Nodularia (in: cyanobacteria)]|uniref:LuxR C-terminal-related transcriptional regulator n=1 Tax=unclassified Nodularia (in: cyanobacteria) TaxID=2656917 RepID=UPI00187FF205|nr:MULTISPECIES: LuxR C-terminal-related transcriptional regulator [unclassified Nodularia (in: cyanobacteria)]MBE9198976.1 LuxR family transcriptional regulator [Nodularia sp. LEGE 06071]MCC2695912.1 LuxR family transcriptional regulator [Nodularia sp. LEGE 04288]
MTISLQLLLAEINQVKDQTHLRSQIAPKIGEYFTAKRWAIFFFDQLPLGDRNLQKILKIALSIEHNPVARYLVKRHAPVHEALVTTPKAWKLICPRPDHWHVMAGPIINHGQIAGLVCCTREKAMPAFDSENLIDLSAIGLHLSAWVARVNLQGMIPENSRQHHDSLLYERLYQRDASQTEKLRQRLTSREWQIAELVGLGLTNAEIGIKLWITENSVKQALKRMFRKLEVSSRAEMVAQLADRRFHSEPS